MALAPWFRSTRMYRKNNVRLGGVAAAVMALAMLTALVTNAAAQAAQSQNLLPEYAPPPPPQGARHQTLTLPQVAPQSSSAPGPAVELPRSQGGEGSLEVPLEVRRSSASRNPPSAEFRSQPPTGPDAGFRICASRILSSMKMDSSGRSSVFSATSIRPQVSVSWLTPAAACRGSWRLPKRRCSTSFGP